MDVCVGSIVGVRFACVSAHDRVPSQVCPFLLPRCLFHTSIDTYLPN